jgi:excisionase family DNA binding protein
MIKLKAVEKTEMEKEYLTIKEAAECLGVSDCTIRGMIKNGELSYYGYNQRNYKLIAIDVLNLQESKWTTRAKKAEDVIVDIKEIEHKEEEIKTALRALERLLA